MNKIISWFVADDEPSIVRGRSEKWENRAALLFSLAVSFFVLLICTRSSPLYPLNDWVDSNCFFTVGKSMFNGKVLYRDIYEQKGILAYFVHGIAYLISNTTFLGVFIYEVLSFAAFLYIAYRTARLFVNFPLSLAILPVLAHSVLTAVSLRQGDSTEEMCLPFIALPIYFLLKSIKRGGSGVPSVCEVFALGITGACVLWIKYTMLGIYIGYVICACIFCIADKKPMRILRVALAFIAGAAVVTVPILIYFAANGALTDMYQAYFYNNMFLYPSDKTFTDKLSGIASLGIYGLSYNGLWGSLVYLGFFSLVLDVRRPRLATGAILLYVGNIFFIYWGGIGWYYYSMGMAALSVPGFVALARAAYFVWRKIRSGCRSVFVFAEGKGGNVRALCGKLRGTFTHNVRREIAYVLAASMAISVGYAYVVKSYKDSDNVFYMEQEREDIWQEKFAKIINASDEQTMLNYSSLDLGVYTTANIVPSEKYFTRLNIDLPEMTESLDSAISEQRVKFVVYRGYPSQFVLQYYKIIAEEVSHLEYENSDTHYYLLERK